MNSNFTPGQALDPFKLATLRREPPKWAPKSAKAARSADLRKGWEELIAQCYPFACYLTVNFLRPYEDRFLIKSVNELLWRLNSELFKRRFKNKRKCLRGICSVEICEGGNLDNRLHFHLLIQPNELLNVGNAVDLIAGSRLHKNPEAVTSIESESSDQR